jgi:hypothetical protein
VSERSTGKVEDRKIEKREKGEKREGEREK